MAVYNEIGIGRWNRFIQKLTDMKGGPPARQLSSEIVFAHPIFSGVETRYLESWDRFSITLNIGAVAAQNGAIRVRNPAGSNVVAVLEKIVTYQQSGAAPFQINMERSNNTTTDLAAIANRILQRMDPRGRDSYTITISAANNIAAIGVEHGSTMQGVAGNPSDWILTENQEVPILPGDTVQFTGQTVNIAFGLMLTWRERFLEPAERT